MLQLILLQIFIGNIVFSDLTGVHFPRILIVCLLYTRHSASLEDVTLFDQFIDAFRVRLFDPGQTFKVCGLGSRNRAFSTGSLKRLCTARWGFPRAGETSFRGCHFAGLLLLDRLLRRLRLFLAQSFLRAFCGYGA